MKSELFLRPSRNRSRFSNVIVIAADLLARDVQVWNTKRSVHLGAATDAEECLKRHFADSSGREVDREKLDAIHAPLSSVNDVKTAFSRG